jgi:hypothetical protein
MPIDDRLRTTLNRDRECWPQPPDGLIEELVARVKRRRELRVIGIAAAAVVCLVLSLAAPQVLSSFKSVDPSVDKPRPTKLHRSQPNTWRLPDRTTPIDGETWNGQVLSQKKRLAPLRGSKLAARGPVVFKNARMQNQGSGLVLWQGHFTARASGHPMGATSLPVEGMFRVEGHQLVVTHSSTPGRTVFRWRKPNANHLLLRLVKTTAPPLYGAPAQVFFKMWSATPFILRGGY